MSSAFSALAHVQNSPKTFRPLYSAYVAIITFPCKIPARLVCRRDAGSSWERVAQFGTRSALKMINILWPTFHFNLANYVSQDPRSRYIVRAFIRGRHQLQLNRNMTKVNAPCAEQGRAQREPGCTCAYQSMGRVEADGAVPASSGRGALSLSSLSVHSIGLASGCAGTTDSSPPPSFMHREPRTGNARSSRPMSGGCSACGIGTRARAPQTRAERAKAVAPADRLQTGPRVIATRAVAFRIKPER